MKIIILTILFICTQLNAEILLPKLLQNKLIGTWKSDKELTSKFNRENAILKKKQSTFLESVTGFLTVEYKKDGTVKSFIPKKTYIFNKKEIKMEEWKDTQKLKVLGYTSSSIVIESENEYFGKTVSIIHFETDDIYWMYLSDCHTNVHAREYFKKIKTVEPTVVEE